MLILDALAPFLVLVKGHDEREPCDKVSWLVLTIFFFLFMLSSAFSVGFLEVYSFSSVISLSC